MENQLTSRRFRLPKFVLEIGLRSRQAGLSMLTSSGSGSTDKGTDTDSAEQEEQTAIRQTAERMLDRHGNAVLRLAFSYLHNRQDAEEVLQDSLLQYLRCRPTLTSEAHEKAWLLKVAANLSKNRIKYNHYRQTSELNEELTAERREDLSFVWDAVRQLPAQYREVIHLYYYEGYQCAEIADILNLKEATVRTRLARGRARLKKLLKEVYDFD